MDRGNDEVDNAYDYHLHLNNYLPTYVSETDQSDEQTPMLGRSINNAGSRKNKNNPDTSSEMNGSIAALPEDSSSVTAANGHSNGDNLCELEDSDDDTLGNANKVNSI